MSTQPEAIRLAETLERMSLSTRWDKEAATELRRLHAANVDCFEHFNALKAERDELLEALKTALQAFAEINHARTRPDWFTNGRQAAVQHEIMWSQRGVEAARAAIARAEAA